MRLTMIDEAGRCDRAAGFDWPEGFGSTVTY